MKKQLRTIFFAGLLMLTGYTLTAQEQKPFHNEIQQFKTQDSLVPPPKNAILFVGSSSFRMWKDLAAAFPKHTVINRGFGGSALPHVIEYAEDIIFPYQPKQVVIYCGENDLSGTTTGEMVFARFHQLFTLIRSRLGEVPIVYVAMKPSPSRWHLKDRMEKGNSLIKTFLSTQKQTAFVDIWGPMLNKDGQPREELFVADKLHMNEKGYAIWKAEIEPYLLKP